ncbi:phosphotransferase [Candidatus Bathyarchaeota archaeon]|nr:phosphotransferase [Candidatus Bathyarchaeota archaeon]
MTTDDRHLLIERFLGNWFPRGVDSISERLPGGDLNDVYRVDCQDQAFVLRIYNKAATHAMVECEHAVVGQFGSRLVEVPVPIPANNGGTVVQEDDLVASMLPFIDGYRVDITEDVELRMAAEMLARLHSVGETIECPSPRPGYPALVHLDWHNNRWWNWASVEQTLREKDQPIILADLSRILDNLPSILDYLQKLELPVVQVHGDYYAGNIRVQDGRIVGIFDWDETRRDYRAWEVARSVWEFCCLRNFELDGRRSKMFIDTYLDAQGEVTSSELSAFGPLIGTGL